MSKTTKLLDPPTDTANGVVQGGRARSETPPRFAWLDLTRTPAELTPDLLGVAAAHGFSGLVLSLDQARTVETDKTKVALAVGAASPPLAELLQLFDIVILDEARFAESAETLGPDRDRLGIFVYVDDAVSLDRACSYIPRVSFLVVDFKDETKIPLELVLATAQAHEARVVTRVHSPVEAEVVMGVLESGSHGVLCGGLDMDRIIGIGDAVSKERKTTQLRLCRLTVKQVVHLGMGERACVDTCSYLGLDEGILVGNFSRGGILLCSETHPLPYMPTRPFRVNAGAIHSYVFAPENRTWYLSDLRSGMQVLAVRTDGTARPVTVGRVKIEQRPLLQVEAVTEDGVDVSTILQEDWHVRAFGADGLPRNSTRLSAGEQLIGYIARPGRHVGIAVNEYCLEQ